MSEETSIDSIKLSENRELNSLFLSPGYTVLEKILRAEHENDIRAILKTSPSGSIDLDSQLLNMLRGQSQVLDAIAIIKSNSAEAVKKADSLQQELDLGPISYNHSQPWIADGSGNPNPYFR